MHYFIDGYNVIKSADWLSQGTLQSQRERLIRFIEEKKPQGSQNNPVTVVFDGRPDVHSPRFASRVRVVFSHETDADGVIKEEIDRFSNPREAVVVTDDRAIHHWVRGAGAKVLSCRVFLNFPSASPASKPQGLDPEAARDINEELKKLWKLK